MSLVLENVSFSQELNDTFQQPTESLSFEVKRRLLHNSRRRSSKTITNKKKQITKSLARTRHLRVQLRSLKRHIR